MTKKSKLIAIHIFLAFVFMLPFTYEPQVIMQSINLEGLISEAAFIQLAFATIIIVSILSTSFLSSSKQNQA